MNKFSQYIMVGLIALSSAAGATAVFAQDDATGTGNVPALVQQVQQEDAPEVAPRGNRGNGELRELASQVFDKDEMKAVVANALGMTVEELDAAKEEGMRLSELAEAQGVEVEDVKAAVQAYRETAVADAINAGIITEEQGEQLLSHEGRRGGKHGRRGGRLGGIVDREVVQATVADTLGITVEELEAAKEAGTSIEDLAAESGVDVETIREAVDAVKAEAVQQAVEDGTITQEQADQILSGEGREGRRGGPRGGGNGPAPAPNAESEA